MNPNILLEIGLSVGKKISKITSPKKRYLIAKSIGFLLKKILFSRSAVVTNNIAPVAERIGGGTDRLALNIFENFAITLSDFLTPEAVSYDIEGLENAEQIHKNGKGFIFLSFHMGFWELGTHVLSKLGWRSNVIYQPYASERLSRLIHAQRSADVNYFKIGDAVFRRSLDALKRNEILVIMGDILFGEKEGAEIDLFGKKCIIPRGPMVLAQRSKAPLVPAFIIRKAVNLYTVYMERPILPSASGDMGILRKGIEDILEKYIRLFPDQWYRFEPVWKTN